MSIYKEIKTKVTQINSSHQQTSTEDRT
jgi:hypothetical protein